MKRILLFAKHGQLGWELQRSLAPMGAVIALDYPEVDFSHPESLRALVRTVNPDCIVNPAAYTAVDQAEAEPELADRINHLAVRVLAEEALEAQIPLVHFSTDYVFDGSKGSAYVESDNPNPINVYGHSKLAGDQAVLALGGAGIVLRTSWVYSTRKGGFVSKVLSWARQQEVMRVVDDQISGPSSARMLAEITAQILGRPYAQLLEHAGLYHCAGDGACSRFAWAQKILELDPRKEEQLVKRLEPARSEEFLTPAQRPLVSVLDCGKLKRTFALRMPPWQSALQMMLDAG